MAENQYNSKIVLASGEVLMDLTQDTVVADKLLKGFTAHGRTVRPSPAPASLTRTPATPPRARRRS